MNIVKVSNLTKYYGKFKGIEDINFTVEEGEIFGFIGPNGAGKSTAIRSMLNLITPTSGNISILDMDSQKNYKLLKNLIGYLPSECNFYEDLTVSELLCYSASFYKGNFSNRINELCDILDLDVTKKVDELSYGNKKKVGIVQALLHNPKLLILDEPTGGLDPLMQEEFFRLIEKEKEKGTTIIFSSHILTEVQRLCSRVAIIKDGRIIKVERVEDLVQNNFKIITIKSTSISNLELEGISNLTKTSTGVKFLYKGAITNMLKYLADKDITDISIEDPSLEDIFMSYYGEVK